MDRTRQLVVIAVLALLIIAGLVYEFVIPQVKDYQQLSATLQTKQEQVHSDRMIASSLRRDMATFNQTKSDLNTAGELFDTEMRDGSSEVLLGLRTAATEVTITAVTPGLITEKPNYLELPLDLAATGNYLNVVAFYADLERLTNLTDLRIFKIVAAPTADDDSNVTITMSMVVFTAKTPTERLALAEISNWAIGRDNVFEPEDGFGEVSTPTPTPTPTSTTPPGVTPTPTPGLPGVPPLPQQPLEPFSSGSLRSVHRAARLHPVSSETLQK
jgi:Tfp pilus assembly protein PilO